MDESRHKKAAELAPLTMSFAMHLSTYLMRTLPRQSGRPRKDEIDITARTEMRLLEAMDYLVGLVKEKRPEVYDLVAPAVLAEKLTQKWLMQTLDKYMPGDTIIYPQRLREWRRNQQLLSTPAGTLDPQYVSCILLARQIDQRRSGWLPRPPVPESYWCWRQDTPTSIPYPYEPITQVDTQSDPQMPAVVRRTLPAADQAYILWTPWKGAAWDDPVWVLVDGGVIRWVGLPSEDQLAAWLSPQEKASLAPLASQGDQMEQALRILADRMKHSLTSNGPT